MSNYPDGCPSSNSTTCEMRCKDCGHHWEADAIWDLGMVDMCDEDDAQCPECESWETE